MNPAWIILLLIIAWFLGMLGLGVKQWLAPTTNSQIIVSTPQNNQVIKVTNTAPIQATTTSSTSAYIPWWTPIIQAKEQTLLEKAHKFAYEQGITSYSNISDFKPQEPLSREWAAKMFTQFAKLIYGDNYFKIMKSDSECSFIDKAWIEKQFYRDILEACSLGFMWWTDGHFAPKIQLTHEQANIILSRITQLPVSTGSSMPITRGWLIETMLDQYLLRKSK